MEKNGFSFTHTPVSNLPIGKNFTNFGVKMTSQITLDCKIYFRIIFSRNTDRKNAIENFFGSYKQDALDEKL